MDQRLRMLNEYRKSRGLRLAENHAQAHLFLTEEHARHLLPSDHVFPWGDAIGHANKGPPEETQHNSASGVSDPACREKVEQSSHVQVLREET